MSRFFALVCLVFALGCARIDRPIGSYTPELGQAGDGGQSAAPGVGTPSDLSKPWKSSGCGRALPPEQVPTVSGEPSGFTPWHVDQTGATLAEPHPEQAQARQFFVRVPADYDPNRPYRVVYLARGGCDAQSATSTSTYELYNEALGGNEQTVYVDIAVPDNPMNPGCYDTTTGLDSLEYELFDLVHGFVESRYCVDNNRIFVAGYSQGGALANTWGCYFGGIPDPPRKFAPKWAIRGHATVAGWREVNQPLPCNGPSAGIWIHEIGDMTQGLYGSNTSALMLGLQANGCSGNYDDGPKQAWAPVAKVPGLEGGACQLYTGCSRASTSALPLVFCDVAGSGGSDRAELAIPTLTAFFDSMEPSP